MKLSARMAMVTAVVTIHLLTICVQAQTWRVELYGCLQGRSANAEINLRDFLVRTGDRGLDAAIEDDITALDSMFGVNVSVYFPNDDLPDASFTPDQNRELILRDDGNPDIKMTGSVFISRGFLMQEYRENNGSLMSIPAILAHEFAHAMQYKNNFPYGRGVYRELHADFMAGWYVAHRCRCRNQDKFVAFRSFYRKGDNRGFFDPDHHGTPDQRASAMAAGFKYNFAKNDGSATSAYNAGLDLVKTLR